MGLFGAYNLVRAIASAHIFIGYILITAPQKLAAQSTIVILGEALGLQQPRAPFHENSLASALAGLVFVQSGISDLLSMSSSEDVVRGYWDTQAPFRTLFFSIIATYTYLMKPGRGNISPASDSPLVNSVVFSWAFLEVIWWFWVYTKLRDEKAEAGARIMQRKKAKREMEMDED